MQLAVMRESRHAKREEPLCERAKRADVSERARASERASEENEPTVRRKNDACGHCDGGVLFCCILSVRRGGRERVWSVWRAEPSE